MIFQVYISHVCARGHHVYKDSMIPFIGKTLPIRERKILPTPYMMVVMKTHGMWKIKIDGY